MLSRAVVTARQIHSGNVSPAIWTTLRGLLPVSKKSSELEPTFSDSDQDKLSSLENDSFGSSFEERTFEIKSEAFDPNYGRAVEETFATRNALRLAMHALDIRKRVAEFEHDAGRFLINGEPLPPFKTFKAAEGDVYDFIDPEKSTGDVVVHHRLQLISFGTKNYKGEERMVIRKFKGMQTPREQFWPNS